MTLVTLPSPILYPGILGNITGTAFFNTVATVDAAGEYVAYVFTAQQDMTISHVGFRAGTATGSPNIIVSIEGVDGSGFPDGAATYGGSASAATLVASNTNPLIALGGSATITKGQVFCAKIAYSSGTSLVIQHTVSATHLFESVMPYKVVNTGTPTRSNMGGIGTIALGSSSTTFYPLIGTIPLSAVTAGAFNNTNSAKRGLLFTPPMKCRAIGVRWYNANSTGNYNVGVYTGDASGTELSSSSTAFDGDHNAAGTAGLAVYFDNPVTLNAGTAYRVAVEPTSATNVNVTTITLPSSDYTSASPAGSTAMYSALASGTWTDSSTLLPLMDVIIDQVDDGTGSGSGGGQRVFGG